MLAKAFGTNGHWMVLAIRDPTKSKRSNECVRKENVERGNKKASVSRPNTHTGRDSIGSPSHCVLPLIIVPL